MLSFQSTVLKLFRNYTVCNAEKEKNEKRKTFITSVTRCLLTEGSDVP